MRVCGRQSPDSASTAGEQQKQKLFDWWHKTAYRGTPKPTESQRNDRMREFLQMVKQCDCGKWHLEMGSKCSGCDKASKNGEP